MTLLFGDFELDEARFELRSSGGRIDVQPKVLKLLLHLVHHRTRAVSSEELLSVLWPGETVTAASVKRAVRGARRALGDSGDSQESIRTVRGLGYQFLLPTLARTELPGSDAPGESTSPGSSRSPLEHAFVGREGVLGVLEASLRDALAGNGRAVLLVGEPGIGKTRTLHELARCAAADADVWLGRCLEDDGAPAFWPWMQILRAGARERGAPELLSLMGAGAADIAQAIPALQRWLPELPSAPTIEQAHARFRFFDSIVAFLQAASRQRPIVLLFDDLQRADQSTLRLLSFVAGQLDGTRLLIVGSCRPSAPRRDEEAWHWDSLAREMQCACLKLEGLGVPDVARFVELQTGTSAPGGVIDRLHQQTAGNPLFLQQILHSWWTAVPAASEAEAPARWQELLSVQTEGLRGAIGRHLTALSEPCRELLSTAAVLGRDLAAGDEAAMREHPREQVLARLGEAVNAGVVRELPTGLQQFAFTHVLLRDALYEQLKGGARALMHARAGLALEARGPIHDPRLLAELAHHFVQAAPEHDGGRAVSYALRAAQAAQQCLGYEEAAAHFDRALSVCEVLPCDAPQRLQLLLAKGEALLHASELVSARAALQQAVTLARELGATDAIARAALLFARAPVPGLVDWEQVDVLRDALAQLPAHEPRRGCLQALLSKALWYSRDLDTRTSLALAALALARKVADPELRAETLRHCHLALSEPHQLQLRVEIAEELTQLGRERGDHRILMHAATAQIQNGIELGELAAVDLAIVTLDQLVQLAREPYFRWYALVYRGMRQMVRGRFELAEQTALEAMRAGGCFGQEAAYHYYLTQVAGPWRIQGRVTEAETHIADVMARYPNLPGWRAVYAGIQLDLGRRERAKEMLDQLMREELVTLRSEPFAFGALAPLAELCAQAGSKQMAETMFEVLLPYGQQWGGLIYGVSTYGPVARHLAMLAGRAGDMERAERYHQDAMAQLERASAPSFMCLTRISHARLLLRQGTDPARERAADLLGRSLQVARDHRFHGLARQCELIAEYAKLELGLGATPAPVVRAASN